MYMKATIIRLPDDAIKKIQKLADEKGLKFATMCRVLILEKLKA